jgi:hypothetical protein
MALETEIRAYDARREELERLHRGKYVVFHGEDFVGAFDDFNAAAAEAVRLFGRGPYLIREVGVAVAPISASLAAKMGLRF